MWMGIANRCITHSWRMRRQRKESLVFIPKDARESAVPSSSDIISVVYCKDIGFGLPWYGQVIENLTSRGTSSVQFYGQFLTIDVCRRVATLLQLSVTAIILFATPRRRFLNFFFPFHASKASKAPAPPSTPSATPRPQPTETANCESPKASGQRPTAESELHSEHHVVRGVRRRCRAALLTNLLTSFF